MTDKERLDLINEKWGNYPTDTTKGMRELCLDFEWLLEQAEKLEEIRSAFYDKDTDVVECYRKQIEIFEGKKTPLRKARS